MKNDDDVERDPVASRQYTAITNRLRQICEIAYSIRAELPWYVRMTKKLAVKTTHHTGISGDAIEDIAMKVLELQESIAKLKARNRDIARNLIAARFN